MRHKIRTLKRLFANKRVGRHSVDRDDNYDTSNHAHVIVFRLTGQELDPTAVTRHVAPQDADDREWAVA